MNPARRFFLLFASIACMAGAPAVEGNYWVLVARDPNYEIWIDSSRVSRRTTAEAWDVWFRTVHTQPRNHKGKEFQLEVVNSLVRCDNLSFRVASVDMYTREGKLVALQRADWDDVRDQPWRAVVRGTSEEIAAQAACHYAAERVARYPSQRTR